MEIYKEKANLYDKYMKAIKKDYEEELNSILPFLKKGNIILELGGGTGNFAEILSKKGFKIICSDISEEMMDIAKKKNLICKKIDMRNFVLDKKVDLIISLFNTIMYNKDEKEFNKNIISVKDNLNQDGKFIIEVTNPEKLLGMDKFVNSLEIDPGIYLTHINKRDKNYFFHYFIFIDTNLKECSIDSHKTRIFKSIQIKKLLEREFRKVEILEKGNHIYFISTK